MFLLPRSPLWPTVLYLSLVGCVETPPFKLCCWSTTLICVYMCLSVSVCFSSIQSVYVHKYCSRLLVALFYLGMWLYFENWLDFLIYLGITTCQSSIGSLAACAKYKPDTEMIAAWTTALHIWCELLHYRLTRATNRNSLFCVRPQNTVTLKGIHQVQKMEGLNSPDKCGNTSLPP